MAAKVDGHDSLTWIDTGNTSTILHQDTHRPRLASYKTSYTLVRHGVSGVINSVVTYSDVPVSVGELPTRNINVSLANLHSIPSCGEWRIDSSIGMDYLDDFVLVMPSNLRNPQLLHRRSPTTGGSAIEMAKSDGFFSIPVQLPGGIEERAILDTGLQLEMTFSPAVLGRLKSLGNIRQASAIRTYTVFGAVDKETYILRRVVVGGGEFVDVPVREATRCIIGLGILRHLNCEFDFPNKEAWISAPDIASPFRCNPDASGLVVAFMPDNRAYVRRLQSGYPGSNIGITPHDELLSIDGVPVAELSIYQIDDILAQAGKTVHLKLKSGEREYEVDLKLDRPFEYPPKREPEDPNAAPRPFPKLEPEKK